MNAFYFPHFKRRFVAPSFRADVLVYVFEGRLVCFCYCRLNFQWWATFTIQPSAVNSHVSVRSEENFGCVWELQIERRTQWDGCSCIIRCADTNSLARICARFLVSSPRLKLSLELLTITAASHTIFNFLCCSTQRSLGLKYAPQILYIRFLYCSWSNIVTRISECRSCSEFVRLYVRNCSVFVILIYACVLMLHQVEIRQGCVPQFLQMLLNTNLDEV
jgi:hypothetical protein